MEGSKICGKCIQLLKIHQPKDKKILELYNELWNYISFTTSSVSIIVNKTDRLVKFQITYCTETNSSISNSHLGQGQSKRLPFTFLHNSHFVGHKYKLSHQREEEANSNALDKFPLSGTSLLIVPLIFSAVKIVKGGNEPFYKTVKRNQIHLTFKQFTWRKVK